MDMGSTNVGNGKSGSYLVDLSSADDMWRQLADSTPAPQTLQRLSKAAARPPGFGGERTNGTFAKIKRVRQASAGFVSEGGPRLPQSGATPILEHAAPDPWKSGERRLWFAAGTLMSLAIAVLTVFAIVNFGGHGEPPVAGAPSSPIPGAPEFTAPTTSAAQPNTFRPPLPARVRAASEPKQTHEARKHTKKSKAKKLARND